MNFITNKNKEIDLSKVSLITISNIYIEGRSVDRAIIVENGRDIELFGADVYKFQRAFINQ